MASMKYMEHVDGLRALAVISVLMFHFGVSGFSGGFVGVDIFFVISGYLISKIILSEIDNTGAFSFKNFYARRVRRLFPALIAVLILTAAVGAFLLTPENLVEFGGSLAAASLSISNILFWFESGYFDTASHFKPLLHTWSLSVEEQFYLVWPFFLLVLSKFRAVTYFWMLLLVGIASFLLNYLWVSKAEPGYQSTIFFLTPFRVFEFCFGALAVYLERIQLRSVVVELLGLLGLALCMYSIIFLSEADIFPYTNALAVCIGTFLVIISEKSTLVTYLLKNRLAVFIGLISYSLYLVHWPIYVYAKYIYFELNSVGMIVSMTALSFALSVLIYFLIERRYRRNTNRAVLPTLLCLMLLITALGIAMKFSDGWMWRYKLQAMESTTNSSDSSLPLSASQIDQGKADRYKDLPTSCSILKLQDKNLCFMDRPVQILMFGNSHEPDGFNIFNAMYEGSSLVNIINFGSVNECNFMFTESGIESIVEALECNDRFALLNSKDFTEKITHIVYSTNTGFEWVAKDLWTAMALLKSRNDNLKIIALGSYISTNKDCATIKNTSGSFEDCKKEENVKYFNPMERVTSKIPEVQSLDYLYINKFSMLCKDNLLENCEVTGNGEPMFYDGHHLSYGFARYIGARIARQYRSELMNMGLPPPNMGL